MDVKERETFGKKRRSGNRSSKIEHLSQESTGQCESTGYRLIDLHLVYLQHTNAKKVRKLALTTFTKPFDFIYCNFLGQLCPREKAQRGFMEPM